MVLRGRIGKRCVEGSRGGADPLNIAMSTHTTNRDETAVGTEKRRYAELNIGDEEFVIYDRENHQAWIQSSLAVSIEQRR